MASTAPSSEIHAYDELGRWLTLERIARSDFMQILFDGLHDGIWSQDEAMDLAEAALRGFANGCCYYLASAVARQTGWPILGFMRPNGDGLIHAVLVDPQSGDAFDILGRRPIGDLKREILEAVGQFGLAGLPIIAETEPDEREILLEIAAGLPWMPIAKEPEMRGGWGRLLIAYVSARTPAPLA
jgi:hypothetical protein